MLVIESAGMALYQSTQARRIDIFYFIVNDWKVFLLCKFVKKEWATTSDQ